MLHTRLLVRFCQTKPLVVLSYDPKTQASTITLNNLAKRNSLSHSTLSLLRTHISSIQSNIQNTRSLFIRAEGPVFSSGHDLKELSSKNNGPQVFKMIGDICQELRRLPIPVVAVIDGLAAAAGLQLVASTDLVIATSKSYFSTPGVKWGIFCTTPGVALIRSFSSEKKAMEMLLLGQPISAGEAYNFGLVSKVVESQKLEEEVEKYAQNLQHMSKEILALGKQGFYKQRGKSDLSEAYKYGEEVMCQNLKLDDGQEGLKAFGEKRSPSWKK